MYDTVGFLYDTEGEDQGYRQADQNRNWMLNACSTVKIIYKIISWRNYILIIKPQIDFLFTNSRHLTVNVWRDLKKQEFERTAKAEIDG